VRDALSGVDGFAGVTENNQRRDEKRLQHAADAEEIE